MAVIETGMYSNMQAPDILGGIQQGMRLKDMANQQALAQKDKDYQSALKQSYKPDANGNLVFDSSTLGNLASIDPTKAYALQQTNVANQQAAKEQQLKLMSDKVDYGHKIITGITDEASYQAARPALIQNGIYAPNEIPEKFDQDWLDQHKIAALDAKGQFDQHWKANDSDQKDRGLDIEQQNADTKAKEAAAKVVENSLKRQELGVGKEDKMAKDLDTHLDKGWVGRSGQAGLVQGKLVAAEAAEQLIAQGKTQPNGLTSSQIEELAQSTGKLLGGGAAASARVEALVPHTAWGGIQSLHSWASNSPQGADQQAFTDQLAETVAREKALANNQKLQFQIEGLPAHAALKKKNPDLYNQILAAKGIDPSMIDNKGRYKQQSTSGSITPPKPGDVEDGHVFLGGDPSKPESWKAQ